MRMNLSLILSRIVWAAMLLLAPVSIALAQPQAEKPPAPNDGSRGYLDTVLEDQPVAYWRLEETDGKIVSSAPPRVVAGKAQTLDGERVGEVKLHVAGPRPEVFPEFDKQNFGARFSGKTGYIRIADPKGAGDHKDSVLDFRKGDSITIEAWVDADAVGDQQQLYIVGKGRTGNSAVKAHNQNWALRLRGVDGAAGVSFLFRGESNRSDKGADTYLDWHRWTSEALMVPGRGWHHVAVTYTFGKGDSIRGYIDGKPVTGTWDMGGKTDAGPVVDDDDIWIGSSMAGSPGSTFRGAIDEVAVYRTVLSPKRIADRFEKTPTDEDKGNAPIVDAASLPAGKVRVEIVEGIASDRSWQFLMPRESEQYDQETFALANVPSKYSDKGIIVDRSNPYLVRLSGKVKLPAGEYRLLLRSLNSARLFVDGKETIVTRFVNRNASGHERVPPLPETDAALAAITSGHQEKDAKVKLAAGEHVFVVELFVGGKGVRPEVGELLLAIGEAKADAMMSILSPSQSGGAASLELTEENWSRFVSDYRERLLVMNAQRRALADAKEREYWDKRHALARELLKDEVIARAKPQAAYAASNEVDHYLNEKLAAAGVMAGALVDDHAFVRRLYIDTVGVIPSPQEIEAFIKDARSDKRARLIDKLLADPRWADNWVGYWQDVLAENPGLLKPTLNNTGPFRWYLFEALYDNRPMDRFATELILMEGSKNDGGAAGFAMASQNDLPMAAKAHILGKAFLGIEMGCARCHDAPNHPFEQKDLFSLAAMLDRKAVKVPKTSVVPVTPEEAKRLLITITLKPGESIDPAWPFEEFSKAAIPEGVLRDAMDSREQLAAHLTSPQNKRFVQVAANRLWHRLMGYGIVDPVDDWEHGKPSHPELLAYLGHELAMHDYDLKHVAKLILNSHAYQREVGPSAAETPKPAVRLFAQQARRRMTAEQVVDSLFAAVGKPLGSEALTFDPDGRRPATDFLNFGVPRRAWEFTGMANERDRPALALPMAQNIVDLLQSFGWRESRQDPITVREQAPTVLQPLMLGNGLVVSNRVARLSDDSAMTDLALREVSLRETIKSVYVRALSREPSESELALFEELLRDGYDARRVPGAPVNRPRTYRTTVSWANHLSAEATEIKYQVEKLVREGDPPTQRLKADWRDRMEDMVWALVNSPEFVFVP
ncbi:MAG: DUF1553 domain-containing protein, partial [Phycisphaeraceae bacterium]